MTNENEFEQMYDDGDDFEDTEDSVSDDEAGKQAEGLVSEGGGLEYDFDKAPDTTKRPEREDLDGEVVTITDAKIILPEPSTNWKTSRDGSTKYKQCQFILFYGDDGQREYYSGVKVFPRQDKQGNEKYSHPNIYNKGKNQASKLKEKYAKYKGKKMEEISMKEFLHFLKSNPKALIEQKEYRYDDNVANKNIVKKFVNPDE